MRMFEGTIASGHLAETGDGLALRELAWADLVARLAATREVRAEFERMPHGPLGGFRQFSKVRQSAEGKGKRAVNRNALSDGKFDEAIDDTVTANCVVEGDREA